MAATLRDIAKELNLSASTISKVLNGKGTVAKETREKILSFSEQLNYRPNENARSLRTQQSRTIGLLVADVTNPFYALLVKIVEEVCRQKDYSVILCNCDYNIDRQNYYFDLLRAQVCGLIFASFGDKEQRPDNIIVTINQMSNKSNLDWISIDNREAMYTLTQYIVNLGHREIGCIAGFQDADTAELRYQGYVDCMAANRLSVYQDRVFFKNYKFDQGYESAKKMMTLGKRLPSAILCHNNVVAMGAYKAFTEAGYSIPEDISLACFDAVDDNSVTDVKFTCIAQPIERIGKEIVELILKKNSGEIPKNQVFSQILPFNFVLGNTVKKREEGTP
jgi:LacI family transcriptional regulator